MTYQENILITPSMARQMMAGNAENQRNIKLGKVREYAEMMKEGQWIYPTGETLKIDTDGRLIDGQNRLQAVIESGVPVRFDIRNELDPTAMLVLDSGASRNLGDSLAVFGTPQRAKAAAIVRWVMMWDNGIYRGSSGRTGWSPSRMKQVTEYQRDALNYDASAARGADAARHRLGPSGPAGTAHYLLHRIDASQAEDFFDHVISGANLPERHPAKTLRERLLSNRTSREGWDRYEQLAAYIRGWNAFRKNEPLTRIVITNDGRLTNSNFPQPK